MSMRHLVHFAFAVSVAACATSTAAAQAPDITQLSLEDLLDSRVRSVSLTEQQIFETAAAVHVITGRDLQRSGVRTIPDALRMVPGFAVAQIDAGNWAVTSRGLNGLYASKLLVMVDGRRVHSMTFGGVHWDMLNIPMANIDRIEVVRGPGSTAWGGNALNGIVNIITKPAAQSVGLLVGGALAGPRRGATDLQYGWRAGGARYHAYARYDTRESGARLEDPDTSRVRLGGARADWSGDIDGVSLQAMAQDGKGPLSDFTDGSVMLSWRHSASSRSERAVQASYQAYRRRAEGLGERWHILEVNGRWRRALGDRHDLNFGTGYRFGAAGSGRFSSPRLTVALPEERIHIFSAFLHDNIELTDRVRLTPGSTVEHNPYTGVEVHPALRMTWLPARSHAVWWAASRAVRTPATFDRAVAALDDGPALQSEKVRAFEAGYRTQASRASIDVTAFRNDYDDLRRVPFQVTHARDASSHGAEIAGSWHPTHWWRVDGAQAWLFFEQRESTAPGWQSQLRTTIDLPGDIDVAASAFRVSSVEGLQVEAYTKVDVHVEMDLGDDLRLTVGVRDLGHGRTSEFRVPGWPVRPVRPSVFGGFEWDF